MKIELNNKKLEKEFSSNITQEQKNFLETNLGKTVNTGINIGLRMILPDLLENKIIEIKDELLNNGVKAGIDKAIQNVIDFGKSITGIITGNFDNINQVQNAIEKGGVLDTISQTIDIALNTINNKKIISPKTTKLIKDGKNVIINNISTNIEKVLTKQTKGFESLEKYNKNWEKYFDEKNFNKMDKEYKKIKTELNNLIPLEKVLRKAREIENIHILIQNNGQDFNLSEDQIELAKIL